MKGFDLEEERVKQEIMKRGSKRVLVQLPEGLKTEVSGIARTIEEVGSLPIFSADPCYGACDLAASEAESLGADLIVHYGHTKLIKHEKIPTIYVEARATIPIEFIVKQTLPLLKKWSKIGVATTIQHIQTLDVVREILVRAGKTVVIGDSGHMRYAGQIIGCNYSNVKSIAKDVDAFLFVGGGRFHALGVALSTLKPTIIANPYENKPIFIEAEVKKIFKQRWKSIQEARKATIFAVIVGLKNGQKRLQKGLEMRDKLERYGKTSYILAAREIKPEILVEFPRIDAYINTACPRVSLDFDSKWHKPVLTINEAMVVFGELSWEELCKKGLFANEN